MTKWKKIWTEIAEAFDTSYNKRSGKQEQIAALGLCHALILMDKSYLIPTIIMPTKSGYWWRFNNTGRAGRITFAGLMAAMGDKGFDDFLKWCESNPDRKE